MDHYSELLEDDDQTPDAGSELAELSWRAGYGAAAAQLGAGRQQ